VRPTPPEAFSVNGEAASNGLDIAFRPMKADDLPLFADWLAQPHWREWWGDPQTEIGYIRDMLAGLDTTRPYIFLIDGHPGGYIQMWFIADQQASGFAHAYPWLMDLPSGGIGVDLSIGDPALLSRGIGSAVLGAFTRELDRRGFGPIIIDPDPANSRAVKAYRKAGFRPVPRLEGRTGDFLIMQFEPENRAQ